MYYIEDRDRDIEILAQSILELTEQLEEQKKLLKELFVKVEDTSKNSSNNEKADKQDVDLLFRTVEDVKVDMSELAEIIDYLKESTIRTERSIPTLNNRMTILETKVNQFGGDIAALKAKQAEMNYKMRRL